MDVESKGLKSDLVKGHRTSKRMDQRRKGTKKTHKAEVHYRLKTKNQ